MKKISLVVMLSSFLLLVSVNSLAFSPTLVLAPSPGIGILANTGLWGLRFEGNAVTDASGMTGAAVELDRPIQVRWKWLPAQELDLGLRYSTADKAQVLVAVGRRFNLYSDLHFDVKLGVCAPGGVFAGAKVVQDWY